MATSVVDSLIKKTDDVGPVKNPAAVALGRKGGSARVPKGFSMMSKEQRSEIGRAAAKKRWSKTS